MGVFIAALCSCLFLISYLMLSIHHVMYGMIGGGGMGLSHFLLLLRAGGRGMWMTRNEASTDLACLPSCHRVRVLTPSLPSRLPLSLE